MSETATIAKVKAMLTIVQEVGQAIKEAGVNGLVSGHLYALVISPLGMSLHDHYQIISILTEAHLVKEENHVLYWIEPE